MSTDTIIQGAGGCVGHVGAHRKPLNVRTGCLEEGVSSETPAGMKLGRVEGRKGMDMHQEQLPLAATWEAVGEGQEGKEARRKGITVVQEEDGGTQAARLAMGREGGF